MLGDIIPSSEGLSGGAKAGIGVGVVLAVALIVLTGFRFRRKKRQSRAAQAAPAVDAYSKPELEAMVIEPKRSELPTASNRAELDAPARSDRPSELP